MTIASAVFDYMQTCPYLDEYRVFVDFLPEKSISFSLSAIPTNPVVKTYTAGGGLKRYDFALSTIQEYGSDAYHALEGIGLNEKIASWLEDSSKSKHLPTLPDGLKSYKIELVSSGYLFSVDGTKAKYQMQIALHYIQGV